MPALASLIPELEEAIGRGSAEKRAETLRRITDLFVDGASSFNDEHVRLFDDVFGRLITEIETKALVELSRRLAPVSNGPTEVLRKLAKDEDITIAGPVLLRSKRLSETDLVDIARSKSQAHLLAISGRAGLGETVTEVLVKRGDREVVRNVATNRNAKFSRDTFAALVTKAEKDGVLAEQVGQRKDIPPHLFRKLLLEATEVVQHRLLASARPGAQAEIKRALDKVAGEISAQAPSPRDYAQARRTVLALRKAGGLGEQALLKFAKAGKVEETVASLSALCAVPIEVVDRLISGDQADPVLILCKAVGFDWPTVRAVIMARPAAKGMSSQGLDAAFDNYERLSLSTAQRVVRFWQVRQQDT